MIGLRSLTTGNLRPMEFIVGGDVSRTITLPATISVTGTESYLATARLGLGLFQVPRFHAEEDLARGTLVRVLPDCSAALGAGVAALPAQPPAIAARARVPRLGRARVRRA